MKLRRKNKTVQKELPSFLKLALLKFNQRLHRIANFLQDKSNHYSKKKKRVLLALFIAIFVSESTMIIVQSLTHKSKVSIAVTPIKTVSLQNNMNPNFLITQKQFLKIQRFKNYVDSLGSTVGGRKVKDTLLHNRPHLMDSVNFLITLYLEQSKTKQNER